MKLLLFSLVFFVSLGFFMLPSERGEEVLEKSILRVAFPNNGGAHQYEPTRIYFSDEYIFLETVYSTLIELDDTTGKPFGAIANRYYWEGDSLHLEIRKDLYTADGHNITAADVEFSLKRILVLNRNTHGDFNQIICSGRKLADINDHCEGLIRDGNIIILSPKSNKNKLVSLLAAIDFAILPKESVDQETLKIVDYRNTSGPYFVERDHEKGEILLAVNKDHFKYHEGMADYIKLVPTRKDKEDVSLTYFKENKVDVITTIQGIATHEILKLSSEVKDVDIHQTLNIKSTLAFASERCRKRFSKEERVEIADILRTSVRAAYKSNSAYVDSNQYFLDIKNDQSKSIDISKGVTTKDKVEKELLIGIRGKRRVDSFRKLLAPRLPQAKFIALKALPSFLNLAEEETPDFVITTLDSGFMGDISLVSYAISSGVLGLSRQEGADWLSHYMAVEGQEEKNSLLLELQQRVVKDGLLVPLVATSYTAISRSPWKLHLSQIFANNPLWKIRKN